MSKVSFWVQLMLTTLLLLSISCTSDNVDGYYFIESIFNKSSKSERVAYMSDNLLWLKDGKAILPDVDGMFCRNVRFAYLSGSQEIEFKSDMDFGKSRQCWILGKFKFIRNEYGVTIENDKWLVRCYDGANLSKDLFQ